MFYYSLFNPAQIHQTAWVLLQPLQPSTPELDTSTNFCSLNKSFIGSCSQETREINSPIPKSLESQTSLENSFKLKLKPEKKEKSKPRKDEEDFKPNNPEPKKSRRTPQNANRNVIPNIMHQVISFLQKRNKSQKIVEKLINKLGLQQVCSSKRFFYYQLLIKQKLNHYVNAESLLILRELQEPLCEVYSEAEQRHYNKISRLLVQHFLTREFDTIILTSKRVSSDKKLDHLVTKRKILEQISQLFLE